MTSDNLLKFLGTREYLYQVSYQELKSMVVQYPYSLSLRYLLAMKSQQEDNKDQSRNIELLATYGIDRSHFHSIFSEDPISLEELEESVLMGEDFLELKELSSIERELDKKLEVGEGNGITFVEESFSMENPNGIPIQNDVVTDEKTDQILEDTGYTSEKEVPTEDIILTETIEHIEAIQVEIIENDNPKTIEEDFVTLDIEEEAIGEAVGSTTSKYELAPSESYVTEELEFDENGLPLDAVEVNDLFNPMVNAPSIEEKLEDIILESEMEEEEAAVATSDSNSFIENPEEVLDIESKAALKKEESLEFEQEIKIESPEENKDSIDTLPIPDASIPFEVIHSKTDPTTHFSNVEDEEIQADNSKPTTEEEIDPQLLEKEAPSIGITEAAIPTKENIKFVSLDQFESSYKIEKFIQLKRPTAKANFVSWQRQNKDVNALSGRNLFSFNLPVEKGKVVKKKKKNIQKKFQATVAFAEESLQTNDDIASETLAQLLVEQGHYEKAKTMYEELSLILPEKSVFFADQIKKIQNLQKEDS